MTTSMTFKSKDFIKQSTSLRRMFSCLICLRVCSLKQSTNKVYMILNINFQFIFSLFDLSSSKYRRIFKPSLSRKILPIQLFCSKDKFDACISIIVLRDLLIILSLDWGLLKKSVSQSSNLALVNKSRHSESTIMKGISCKAGLLSEDSISGSLIQSIIKSMTSFFLFMISLYMR